MLSSAFTSVSAQVSIVSRSRVDYGDMSDEHDPEGHSWKFNWRFDRISRGKCHGRTGQDRPSDTSGRTRDALDQGAAEKPSARRVQRGSNGVEPRKRSQGTPEDSQGDSSWQTIERSQDSSVSPGGESLSRHITDEPGNAAWKRNENAAGQRNLQTIWNFRGAGSGMYDNKQLFAGAYEYPLQDFKSLRYVWIRDERPGDLSRKMSEGPSFESTGEHPREANQESFADSETSTSTRNRESPPCKLETSSPRTPTFTNLALNVSYAGLDISGLVGIGSTSRHEEQLPELWEDYSVVECLEKKLTSYDESTPEERVEALKEVLAETDIHEGDGIVSDFLFHVARTKYGKIYIRVIRTMLLNRGRI